MENEHEYRTSTVSERSGAGKFDFAKINKGEIVKQSEIPIYERFRGFDINIPRKEKIKTAEKMLRIGYAKDDIIKFFHGGAE